MKKFLVGYTGFVGSNLCENFTFDGLYNSKNIKDAYDKKPELLIYAGVPAQKFIANTNPEKDFAIIEEAIYNIKRIKPKRIVLISTIDIYKNSSNLKEEDCFEVAEEAYGKNRYYLENWVQNNFEDYLIVRLPALYGKNLKKNFIFDLIHFIPTMLKEEKFLELSKKNLILEKYYMKQENGFYKCIDLNDTEKENLKKIFKELHFSALNFTDSRGTYQFYNLKNLMNHILISLENNIKILNIATEPITIQELYYYLYHEEFNNIVSSKIPFYNFKTKYDTIFNGKDGYILDKKTILKDIKKYIEENK